MEWERVAQARCSGIGLGKSEGAEVRFQMGTRKRRNVFEPGFVTSDEDVLTCIYHEARYVVWGDVYGTFAPEHPIVCRIDYGAPNRNGKRCRKVSNVVRHHDRIANGRKTPEKTGEFTGARMRSIRSMVSEIPIWISDYVLMGYGTGAIMAGAGRTMNGIMNLR